MALPCSAANRNHFTASASSLRTPWPSWYMNPRFNCASARPWSAARRNQRAASASSFRTPAPSTYMSPKLYCASASPWSAACRTVSRSSCAESTMMARPPATITAAVMRISLGILFIGFKCGLLSSPQALAYPSQDARRIPGVTNSAWLATPSVRVNPSSQRTSDGIDFLDPPGNSPLWSGERPCATVRPSVSLSL